jgi:arylsulfatase A-like enzyme
MPVQPGTGLYNQIEASPYGNELINQFALRALAAEKLGTSAKIDVLAVSYSSNDYVGHNVGPDAPQVRDMSIRVDALIGELLRAAEAQAGAGNVVTVLTADHGVAPVPEVNRQRRMPGGRLNVRQLRQAVEQALTARFGRGQWMLPGNAEAIQFNPDPVPGQKIEREEMERVAAEALRAQPHVFRVYTRTQLLSGSLSSDPVDLKVRNSFHAMRSADLILIPEPYWMSSANGTTHGTPFDYDTHVPVMFLGEWIKAGRYHRNIAVNDIAPTLATILDVETPSGSVGRVLDEMLQ